MTKRRRFDLKKILADPDMRRKLMVPTIQATQAREGIETTREQADRAYYVVTEGERATFFDLGKYRSEKGEPDRREEMFVRSIRDLGAPTRFDVARRDFGTIEGSPLAYKQIGLVPHVFREAPLLDPSWAKAAQGLATADDPHFVRNYWEVPREKIGEGNDWVPFAKGGEFCRFYSDIYLVVNWTEPAIETMKDIGRVQNVEQYFKFGLTWPLAGGSFSVRRMPSGCIFGHKGPAIFPHSQGDRDFLSGVLNSELAEYLLMGFTSRQSMGGRWEVGVIKRLPIPKVQPSDCWNNITDAAEQICDAKASWDAGNEVCTNFVMPWILREDIINAGDTIQSRLHNLAQFEATHEEAIQRLYSELNAEVYKLYGIPNKARAIIEDTLGKRPSEVLWPQTEGKSQDQKRKEHVWRLLSYAIKRVVNADDDGIVPYQAVAGKTTLANRVRDELAVLFPDHDVNKIEVEIVNELKTRVTDYRTVASIEQWIEDVYFEFHCSLYKNRPIIWHITSKPGRGPEAFGALCHYHKFDSNRMAKLRGRYIRDAIQTFKREAALASQEGRTEDRQEWQAKLEEVQELDRKLQWVQEGFFEDREGGDRDFRILTPWKSPHQRPEGWNPDIDDGVAVNIAPLQRARVLRKEKVV